MTRAYPHLHLTRWPFPVVPQPGFCTFLAARGQLRADVHDLVSALARRDTSSIHLFWAWFGAGKTHTLHYLTHHARAVAKQPFSNALIPIYTEIPKGVRSFFDVYKALLLALDVDVVLDAFLEISTSSHAEAVNKRLLRASPDLASALKVLATGLPQAQALASRWLKGEPVPVSELRRIGVSQKLATSEEATRVLASLIEMINVAAQCRDQPGARLIWILDEFQRISKGGSRVLDDINAGLHTTFNASPSGLSFVFSFSGKPQTGGLPPWFSAELRDRIGPTKVMLLPPMTADEALNFTREVLQQFRSPDRAPPDALFPFTEAACKAVIAEVHAKGELKPRSIMQAFSAVLEAADLPIESRQFASVSPEFAKGVLANYTFVSKDEEESDE